MDTIFALASGLGKAGVAIIRVSGPQALPTAETLCGSLPPDRRAALRWVRSHTGEKIDQGIIVCFPKQQSFTGEATVEFHLHGSPAVVSAVLDSLGTFPGLRHATPGEFTRRALENNRLDLVQIEALGDLIDAETEQQRKQALSLFEGRFSRRVAEWRGTLVSAMALIEATIDFADEEVPTDVIHLAAEKIRELRGQMVQQVTGAQARERMQAGFVVAILGPPNSGKSTLLNFLTGRDVALTSDIPGTTRDVLEVRLDIDGFAVQVLDTAGLRETDDMLEGLGIAKAQERAESADLRVHLVLGDEAANVSLVEDGDIVCLAKDDDGKHENGISGLTGFGVDRLLKSVSRRVRTDVQGGGDMYGVRQRLAVEQAVRLLDSSLAALEDGSSDIAAEELRSAAICLDELVGRIGVEDLLDEIFQKFCLGK